MAIHTNAMYLLFVDENDDRAFMPATDLVECGTPTNESGDFDYFGWTTNYNDAINFVEKID